MKHEGKKPMTRRGMITRSGLALGAALAKANTGSAEAKAQPSIYQAIGVNHVINATGTVTVLGGSLMPAEVVAAWAAASQHFVNLLQLHDKVGDRIAKLTGVEAALITTGAAGAILLGTAAAVTLGARALIPKLPDIRGGKNEVIVQQAHRSGYDNQLTDVGIKMVEVVTHADLTRAVNERTALMFFMNFAEAEGQIKRKEWIEIARRHKIPTLLDAAADVPPLENLSLYNRMGFDLVAISGGKALMGPNDTGLLLGRKDLIEVAKLNTNPYGGTIGRMMKVSKEDMMALLAAVERYVHVDHDAERREWERRLGVIEQALKDLPAVQTERIVPPIANHVPHLIISWDEKRIKLSREDLTRRLKESEPSIQIGRVSGTGDQGVLISVFMLQNGEEQIVAQRLAGLLRKASA